MENQIVGRWTVGEQRDKKWLCRCACGVERLISSARLRSGRTKSCGCYRADVMRARITHGQTRRGAENPTFISWRRAQDRCYNPKAERYPSYGGRGIAMCQHWRDSYQAFVSDMGERPTGTTLGRIDVDGPYEPGNCRWETPSEQARGRRNHNWVDTPEGPVLLIDFAATHGVSRAALYGRVIVRGEEPYAALQYIKSGKRGSRWHPTVAG